MPDGYQSHKFTIAGANGKIDLINTSIAWHQLSWIISGTVSGTVSLDTSVDGITWVAGGAITGQVFTSNGSSAVVNIIANYVRVNMTALTVSAGGSVTVSWSGWIDNPGGGGGGGTIGGSIISTQISIGAATADTIEGSNNLTFDGTTLVLVGNENINGSLRVSGPDPWYDVKAYGAVGDGVTDDSVAVIAAIAACYAGNGGIVWFPPGTYLILSQLLIPNDAASVPNQPSMRLTGSGPSMGYATSGNEAPHGGSILDLRNNAATAKIDTRGDGYLEIDGLTLADFGSDAAAFVFTTNTVLHIHDCSFYGTAKANSTTSAPNDAIILGGTGTTTDGTATAPFQGYGTVIESVYFDNIKRAVLGQTYCNGVQICNNTIAQSCGFITGGAIEFTGVIDGFCVGDYIAGNLIEVYYYKYGINCTAYTEDFSIISNNIYDNIGVTTAAIHFGPTAIFNMVILGWNPGDLTPVLDEAGVSTVISAQQNVPSIFSQPVTFTNQVTINTNMSFTGTGGGTLTWSGSGTFAGVNSTNGVMIAAGYEFQTAGHSSLYSNQDGSFTIWNSAQTGFDFLNFGGTTSSFPTLQVVGTTLKFTAGPGGVDSPMTASNGTFSGVLTGATLIETATHTPASSADTGITGQFAWDANYFYICTATNTWSRVVILHTGW